MSLRVLAALLMLIVLLPVFGVLAVAWMELNSPSAQTARAGPKAISRRPETPFRTYLNDLRQKNG